jgi:hypothetical protein
MDENQGGQPTNVVVNNAVNSQIRPLWAVVVCILGVHDEPGSVSRPITSALAVREQAMVGVVLPRLSEHVLGEIIRHLGAVPSIDTVPGDAVCRVLDRGSAAGGWQDRPHLVRRR